jgi:hypothetical protein
MVKGQIEVSMMGFSKPFICLSELYKIGGMGRDEEERRRVNSMGCIFKMRIPHPLVFYVSAKDC